MRSFATLFAAASLLAVGSMAAPDLLGPLGGLMGDSGAETPEPTTPPANTTATASNSTKAADKPTEPSYTCLSDSDAKQVAANFQESIANYTDELILRTFASDFVDYSDSVIELINNGCTNSPVPLGNATFYSRTDFMEDQSVQPAIPFQILNLWHTCGTVIIRWVSAGAGQEPQQVTGIVVMELVKPQEAWLIKTVYSEFNTGAWLFNLGTFKPSNCSVS